MCKFSKARSVTIEIPYPHPDTLSDSFRVYLCKTNGQWIKTVLVVARGDANPIDYFSDTYDGLNEFFTDEGLDITTFNIYLDMLEFFGLNSQFLFRWDIKNIDKPIQSQIEPIAPNQLSDTDRKVLECYYADKWSIFTESCLTNIEKARLITNLLSNSVYDEYSLESVQTLMLHKLKDTIRTGSKITNIQDYFK